MVSPGFSKNGKRALLQQTELSEWHEDGQFCKAVEHQYAGRTLLKCISL